MPKVENRIYQLKAKVIKNIEVVKNYYKILVYAAQIAHVCEPGQFVKVKVADSDEPLLRRPFSIHRVQGQNIEILYEVVGKGTHMLSQKKSGEYLNVIGPLGNGYSILNTQYSILVAGGMGVAPLLFLAKRIASRQVTKSPSHKLLILMGAKTRGQILCEKEFKELGCEVKISTDDGSKGFKGKVTELLKRALATGHRPQATGLERAACSLRPEAVIDSCGPRPMLKEISEISARHKIPAQISLEEHMACGIGACLGCVVNTKEGYKRVCKEGPVFDAREIIW